MSGDIQVCTYINNLAVYLRLVHYIYLAVCYISTKNPLKKMLFNFHVVQTTPIRQAGLLIPCCSDQDATSPDGTCVSLFLSLLLNHILPFLPLQVPRFFFRFLCFPISAPALPFAPRATIFVLLRSFVAQATTFPGIPPLVTLNSHCPSSLLSDPSSFPCLTGSLLPVPSSQCPPLPNCLQLGINHPLLSLHSSGSQTTC